LAAAFHLCPAHELMDLGNLGPRLAVASAYEAVFARDVNAAPARPAFLMQLTNEACALGKGPGATCKHLAQSGAYARD